MPTFGEGPYSNTGSYRLLPDFTGDTEAQARATASKLGISVTFKGSSGTVVSQSEPANKRIDLMKGSLTLTLSGNNKKEETKDTKKTNTTDAKDNDKEKEKEKEKEPVDNSTINNNDKENDNKDDAGNDTAPSSSNSNP